MNGRLLEGLPLLDWVFVGGNICFNDIRFSHEAIFRGKDRVKQLRRILTEKCGFTETGEETFEKLFDLDCGTVPYATGFIIGGEEAKPGQWPFVVALLAHAERQFFCGGSIITKQHILTAAHCLKQKYSDESLMAEDITVFLGHQDLQAKSYAPNDLRNVRNVSIHPDWDTEDLKYDADVAVLSLKTTIEFTNFIQPACLTMDADLSKKEDGYVVSFISKRNFCDFLFNFFWKDRLGEQRQSKLARTIP